MLATSLGVVLGSWSSALLALYMIASRPYRRVRKRFVLALVKLAVPMFMIGATLLLFTTLQAMHVESNQSRRVVCSRELVLDEANLRAEPRVRKRKAPKKG